MKPFKLLACLVTLQLTCGLTLQAADPQNFRQWTDLNGRTIMARLVETPDVKSVKIERQDGRFFTVPLKTFSAPDQAYVVAFRTANPPASSAPDENPEPVSATGAGTAPIQVAPSTWTLLNSAGKQSASIYSDTSLDEILTGLNQRLAEKGVKTTAGLPFKIRTEPADLATRVQITGTLPDMALAAFVKEVARINQLTVETDAAGMVVLVDKPATGAKPAVASFFGVPINAP